MNIAMIAHDKKKEMMLQFCLAYKSILKKHNLIATEGTGTIVRDGTGLDVNLVLPGSQGGDQQKPWPLYFLKWKYLGKIYAFL